MTFAVSLAMRRFVALLLLATLPLQGLATLVTHTFPGDNGHGAPAAPVQAHDGQQDAAAEDASCCLFAGFCYGSPGLIARFSFPHGAGLAAEPVLIALSSFTSFAPESPERPPLVVL